MSVIALPVEGCSTLSLSRPFSREEVSSEGSGFEWTMFQPGGSIQSNAFALGGLVSVSRQEDKSVIPNTLQSEENYRLFCSSFSLHGGKMIPSHYLKDFYWMANLLCGVLFREAIVQYDSELSMIDYYLILPDGIRLTIGRFVSEDEVDDTVDFSIYRKRKLLVSGEMSLDKLVERIKSIRS